MVAVQYFAFLDENSKVSDTNYMRIRHEDFTVNATTVTQEIYKYDHDDVNRDLDRY